MFISNLRDFSAEPVIEGAREVKIRWMINEDKGADNFVMRHFEIDPNGHTPMHTHAWEHEIFVLSGEGAVVNGEGEKALKEGDVVFIPKGERHQFKNAGKSAFTLLCMIPSKKRCH
ncbi:MAG: cupin domain-containing protein [Candidatus Brocadiales bacterium]|nr:cupin domain-containing protein [Candidatus Bathyanammoxibius sp.]MCQ4574802.1 cupin domain-containing protein [Candidatus Bathyanammoxibius amoris]